MQASYSTQAEEELVAELAQLGINYLSRQSTQAVQSLRPPDELLANLVCQPSSRVRSALIALLLARPDYARYVPKAVQESEERAAHLLRLFYTAAVQLQERYEAVLRSFLGTRWRRLPDLFSDELGITGASPEARLKHLARLHAQWSGENLNWAGTYENSAHLLLRRWEREKVWRASLQRI